MSAGGLARTHVPDEAGFVVSGLPGLTRFRRSGLREQVRALLADVGLRRVHDVVDHARLSVDGDCGEVLGSPLIHPHVDVGLFGRDDRPRSEGRLRLGPAVDLEKLHRNAAHDRDQHAHRRRRDAGLLERRPWI